MQKHKILYILFTVLILTSCEPVKTGLRIGFISCYTYFNPDTFDVTYEDNSVSVRLQPQHWQNNIYVNSHDFVFADNKLLEERYNSLCEKFGDIYPGGFSCQSTDYSAYPAVCFEIINSVSIVSDNDWNAEHPAGTLLNDMFSIGYCTFYPYISNNYTGQTYTLVTTSLSELQEDEMKLIQNSVRLDCATLPTVAQHHTLTVSFDLDTDRTATYYVELDFAAPEAQ